MGKEKHMGRIMELLEASPIVSYSSICRIVGNALYSRQLVHYLIEKGKIQRLAKGIYTKHSDPQLAVLAFKPAYLGLQDALSYHNLWEQETIPVIVTARMIRPGRRTVLGSNILVRRIQSKYYFGIDFVQQGNYAIPYSDIEKTIIDLMYFHQPLSKQVLKQLQTRMNKQKLKRYLAAYSPHFRERVLSLLNL